MTDAFPLFVRRNPGDHPASLAPDYKSTVRRAPLAPLVAVDGGAGEATGPTFGPENLGPLDNDLIANYAKAMRLDAEPIGERIIVHGHVVDQDARPVPNCLIEIWQANAGGRYRHVNDTYLAPLDPAFGGGGRCLTDAEGAYFFRTVRPGPYPWPNRGSEWRPAHIHLSLFGAGLAQRLITQLYFEGDPLIPLCPILNSVAGPSIAERLVARLDMANQRPFDALVYRFDVVLRGRQQSFFENRSEGL